MSNSAENHNPIIRIARFMGKRSLVWLAIVAIGGFASSGLELAAAGLLQLLLQKLGVISQPASLPFGIQLPEISGKTLAIAFAVLAATRGVTTLVMAYGAVVAQEVMGLRLRFLLFYDCLDRPKGYVSFPTFHHRIAQWIPNAVNFCHSLSLLIPNVIYATVLLVALVKTSPPLSVICVAGVAMIGLPSRYLFRMVRRESYANSQALRKLNTFLYEAIRNYFFLKAMAMNVRTLQNVVSRALRLSGRNLKALRIHHVTAAMPATLAGCLVALLIALQLEFKWTEPLQFITFLYLFMRFGQSLSPIGSFVASMNSTYPLFRETAEYFFSFDESTRERPFRKTDHLSFFGNVDLPETGLLGPLASDPSPPPAIELADVTFRYPRSANDVIRGFNLKVAPGSTVGIKGESGAGKSTLLALIMGINEPTSGQVLVDGVSPEKYYANDLPRVGYVGTEPYVIEGTIRDNLLFGSRGTKTDAELIERLREAHLWNDLQREHKTLDFVISEHGDGLSAGQKQRLALARALSMEPKILILDEATANLDADSEIKIMDTVSHLKGKTTILIVSHKPKPLEYVDEVVSIRFGG